MKARAELNIRPFAASLQEADALRAAGRDADVRLVVAHKSHENHIRGLREVGFPVFARGLVPNSPQKDGPGEINVPVTCGGVIVNPGDIVVGDEDGVVVVPKGDAEAVIARTEAILAKEEKMVADIKAGRYIPEWVNQTLNERGCQIID